MKKLLFIFVFFWPLLGFSQVIEPLITADSLVGFDTSAVSEWTRTGSDVTPTTATNVKSDSLEIGSGTANGYMRMYATNGAWGEIKYKATDQLEFSNFASFYLTGKMGLVTSLSPSGSGSVAMGLLNTASGNYSFSSGSYSSAYLLSQQSYAAGRFSVNGDAQTSKIVCRTDTTHSAATWFPIFIDGASTQITISASTVWAFRIMIVGTDDAQSKTFSYEIVGNIERDASNNTTLNGSSVTTIYESDSDFDARVIADDTNEALEIQVQDATSGGDKVRWVARVELTEVTF